MRADPTLLTEWMDEPCTYEDWRACIKDLAQVNRITLAHRPTLQWLNRLVAASPAGAFTPAENPCWTP